MRKALWIFLLAVVIAAAVSFQSSPVPIEHRLISIEASERLPGYPALMDQPVELQAAVIDLGNDPLLLLKAQAAMMVYPSMASEIFPMYAAEPEFQRILRRYGEHALPPIEYFLRNSVSTVEWMNQASVQFQRARDYFNELRGRPASPTDSPPSMGPLTAAERGWYAVNFIDREGEDFLGQFKTDVDGKTHWVQTERITEGVTQFFTGGIRQLESSYRTDGEVTASDIGWASVDVLVFASAVKFLRAGRAVAKTTQTARVSTRSAALAARLTGGARLVLRGARYAKWPAVIGVGYLVISHPGLISDFFAAAADVFGIPPLAGQFVGWALILLPVLYLLSWLAIPFASLLRGTGNLLMAFRGQRHREIL
ncbi:hypothetical protein [Marinobacter sp. CHS3-4]|uniref:hypothetical protein n=1 Tax=Marinobacter sp. CHS3-4 TaxID=3045174 RepID=UPI0024B594C7|nr:hypothetical protein [Marinobacter sp. CHS3-4]MDI9245789.1 hypothetical protein [Marinobacter sp. CHS3-4]